MRRLFVSACALGALALPATAGAGNVRKSGSSVPALLPLFCVSVSLSIEASTGASGAATWA